MKDLRMWFVVIFGLIAIYFAITSFLKDKNRFIVATIAFGFFTTLLLFSDLVAQFMVKAPGIEMSANIDQKINQIKTDQKQLSEVVEEIVELIELVREMPRLATLGGKETEKKIEEFENLIEKQKAKLRENINSNN